MYEYGIDNVNLYWLEGITKCELAKWLCFGIMNWHSGCALELWVEGYEFKPWFKVDKLVN